MRSQPLRGERLRQGFYVLVAEQEGSVRSPTRGAALALLCPLGSVKNAVVRLSAIQGTLDPTPQGGAVMVVIDTGLLQQILNVDYQHLPSRVAKLNSEAIEIPRTVELALAAHAIRGCRHQGAIRNLFLKSKALEMLALTFSALRADTSVRRTHLISAKDMHAVMRAHDLLFQRLDDPPSLDELAVVAGMCETRLKIAFKSLFGETPSNISRRARMAAARDMLVERRCRVSEAAAAVGYTNISHFITAFVREYGVRPGCLVRLAHGETQK